MSLCSSVTIPGVLLGMWIAAQLSSVLYAQDTINIGNSFELGKMHLFYDFSDVNRALAGAGTASDEGFGINGIVGLGMSLSW